MGQANINKQRTEEMERKLLEADVAGIAAAIRKLAQAASSKLLGDCYLHAAMAREMLKTLGVETKLVAGECSWRVGDGDGDVISHRMEPGVDYSPQMLPGHVWLTCGQYIIDVTTYQLHDKARSLDASDGGHTNVEWCPDYLMVKRDSVSSYRDTASLSKGTYYYQYDPVTTNKVVSMAEDLDPQDIDYAWLIYRNPDVMVLGPNSLKP